MLVFPYRYYTITSAATVHSTRTKKQESDVNSSSPSSSMSQTASTTTATVTGMKQQTSDANSSSSSHDPLNSYSRDLSNTHNNDEAKPILEAHSNSETTRKLACTANDTALQLRLVVDYYPHEQT